MATRNIVPRADGEGQLGTAEKKWGEVNAVKVTSNGNEVVTGPGTSTDGGFAVFDGTDGKMIKDSGFVSGDYNFVPIGVPIPVWDHLAINKPPNSGNGAIYIKLTAGQSGPGGYNQGLLRDETVSGSAPLVTATAVINLSDSPIYNQTVHLINTEEAFIRARTTSGVLQNDQIQQLTGAFGRVIQQTTSGIFALDGIAVAYTDGSRYAATISFDSSRVARSGDETRSKNVSATWYLRIR